MIRLAKLFPVLLLCALPAFAGNFKHPDVERLLTAADEPDGVVFELISWDDKTWQWATPMIRDLRAQLKQRFPEIDIAVVSHGGEQFQLTRQREAEQPRAIAQLASLTEEGVDLHVCGTHSYWNDIAEDAYLDFVDVSPSGPAQVNDYIRLGFTHILLQKPY